MIIYTTPAIKKFAPIRISSVVEYAGSESCIAEVSDSFDLTVDQMEKDGLDYYYEVATGSVGTERWDPNMIYQGGFPQMMDFCYSLTKPLNIAIGLADIAQHEGKTPFEIWEQCVLPSTAIDLIAAERERQIEVEKYDLQHDQQINGNNELLFAAETYLMRPFMPEENSKQLWPWHISTYKPSPDNRVRELVKAGALIAAEIERLQYLEKKEETSNG